MLFVETINESMLYLYNDGSAVAIGVLEGDVRFFDNYALAFMWALPF